MTVGSMGLPRSLRSERLPNALLETLRKLWENFRQLKQRRTRDLRLCESLSLGDRRFVAVVEFANSRFLVGGTSASLVLLARLPDRSTTEAMAPTDQQRPDKNACPNEREDF
jgi:flagellar biogenesis protein FliO